MIKKTIYKIIHWLQKLFSIYKITPFYSEERLVNLLRGRECFAGLSILLVDALWQLCEQDPL